jgi:hypothetical protein
MRSFLSYLLPVNVKTSATVVVGTVVGLYAIFKLVNTASISQPIPAPQAAFDAKASSESKEVKEESKDEALESHLVCPITLRLMEDPVSTVKGKTYERTAIENWFGAHDTDPITNEPLRDKRLIPNDLARSLIDEFKRNKVSFPTPVENTLPPIPKQSIGENKQLVWPQVAPRIEEKKSEQYLSQPEAQRRSAATPEILRELKKYAQASGISAIMKTEDHQRKARFLVDYLHGELSVLPFQPLERRVEILKYIDEEIGLRMPTKKGGFSDSLKSACDKIVECYQEEVAIMDQRRQSANRQEF